VTPRPSDSCEDDARRVSACLKACEGIPTEALESQVILRLVAACIPLRDPRVREILEELTERPAGPRGRARPRPRSLRVLPGQPPLPKS